MLASEYMSGMADLYEARGDNSSAKVMRYGSDAMDKTMQYGMGGFMLGGPVGALGGAAVGAAAAALDIVFKELTAQAKALSDSFKSASEAIKTGKQVDDVLKQQQKEFELSDILESGDIRKIKQKYDSLNVDKAALQASMAEVDAEGGAEAYARRT